MPDGSIGKNKSKWMQTVCTTERVVLWLDETVSTSVSPAHVVWQRRGCRPRPSCPAFRDTRVCVSSELLYDAFTIVSVSLRRCPLFSVISFIVQRDAAQMAVVAFIIVAGLMLFQPSNMAPFAPMGVSGVIRGSSAAFFGYLGYDEVGVSVYNT